MQFWYGIYGAVAQMARAVVSQVRVLAVPTCVGIIAHLYLHTGGRLLEQQQRFLALKGQG